MHREVTAVLTLSACLCAGPFSAAGDWPEFRGPTGQGIADAAAAEIPLTWSESENVRWKVPVEGLAWSSPSIVGGRVFLTTAVAGELVDQPAAGKPADDEPDYGKLMCEAPLVEPSAFGPVDDMPGADDGRCIRLGGRRGTDDELRAEEHNEAAKENTHDDLQLVKPLGTTQRRGA